MAIHRTYVVRMPTNAGLMPYLDIPVETPELAGVPGALPPVPPATAARPMKIAVGGTTPPAGWQVFGPVNGDGELFEWRGRTLRCESRFGAANFVPRFRLGWKTAIYCVENDCEANPSAAYSYTLVNGPLPVPFTALSFPDPTYGPTLRLSNTLDTQGALVLVHLDVFDAADEDRAPSPR